ncbi:hypothetical protein LTR22_025651 [Elasticomyces elasticus]|nr:hypothetical protein LTR22_025651 [Elasticomyces elasticus]
MGFEAAGSQAIDDLVFLCVDCEAYEWAQHKVTELGVAILDTRRLRQDISSPDFGSIVGEMKYAHFRPVEYSNLVNRKFIKGCPNSFGFPQSTWIRLADAPRLLARIFLDPSNLSLAAAFDTPWREKRNVVLVGHGLANDESVHLASTDEDGDGGARTARERGEATPSDQIKASRGVYKSAARGLSLERKLLSWRCKSWRSIESARSAPQEEGGYRKI